MSTFSQITELLTSIAIGGLSAIFISAFFILILVCKKSKAKYNTYFTPRVFRDSDHELVEVTKSSSNIEKSEASTHAISMNSSNSWDTFLSNSQWKNDISGMIPHCLAILKHCRSLTERLSALSMGILNSSGTELKQTVESAKQISSKVDDLVRSMYPPLNHQLLEARATSLTLAVTQLAVITQFECRNKNIPMGWITTALQDMETHISMLREAAMDQDLSSKLSIIDDERAITTMNYQ